SFLTLTHDGTVSVWSADGRKQKGVVLKKPRNFEFHTALGTRKLLVVNEPKTVRLLDLATLEETPAIGLPDEIVPPVLPQSTVALAADDRTFAVVTWRLDDDLSDNPKSDVRIYRDGAQTQAMFFKDYVRSVALSPSGKTVVIDSRREGA